MKEPIELSEILKQLEQDYADTIQRKEELALRAEIIQETIRTIERLARADAEAKAVAVQREDAEGRGE